MLVRLFGSNFRSLKDKFELSMVAADLKRAEDSERGVIDVKLDGIDEPLKLLRTVAIYGHNGSGKSTVLLASKALSWLVGQSSARSAPGAMIPVFEPFLLDVTTRDNAVSLGCEVVHGSSLLRYEVSYRADTIEHEKLTALDANQDVLIDRQEGRPVKGSLIARSDANQLYVKEIQPNVAVLSKLAQHGPAKGEDSVQPYYRAILSATRYEDYSASAGTYSRDSKDERFADDSEYRNWIMKNLIVTADIGIHDVVTKRVDVELPDYIRKLSSEYKDLELPDKHILVYFMHEGADSQPIALPEESAGAKKLFNIADDWWGLAHNPITLLADELSASLHPRLLDALIRAVNDAPSDHVQSQLIFATHDTGLMEGHDGKAPALRRDQIYFTTKNRDGASELYSLAEFKDGARPVHNLRKRYLSGLYGAIPLVDKLSL